MAQITPFQPYTYNSDLRERIEDLVAPPYDVITPERLAELRRLHPLNITHLTLPEGEGSARYEHAGNLLSEWLGRNVLERRPQPAFYLYTQTFTHPESGGRITRHGFIGALHLEPFSTGNVLPHERTLSGPREDRLSLMETTAANLEPIFGMYPDPERKSLKLLQRGMEEGEPFIDVIDQGGVRHIVREVTDQSTIAALAEQVAGQKVYIVDGHHRYETALNYRKLRRDAEPDLPEGDPVDSIMIYLSPMSDPGLVILPTHRIVHSLPTFDFDMLLESLTPYFTLIPYGKPEEGFDALGAAGDNIALLLLVPGRQVLATLKPGTKGSDLVGTGPAEAVAELDVSVLHHFVLERLLGIDRVAQEAQQNLHYAKSTADAVAALGRPETQLVVGMNPPRFSQVEDVAGSGDVMPQKSTYFYPKLASGLLVNRLDG